MLSLGDEADEDGEKDLFRECDPGRLFDGSHPAPNPGPVRGGHCGNPVRFLRGAGGCVCVERKEERKERQASEREWISERNERETRAGLHAFMHATKKEGTRRT